MRAGTRDSGLGTRESDFRGAWLGLWNELNPNRGVDDEVLETESRVPSPESRG
ncbi:MAG: hypothetical protein ACREP2_07630 [Rhodanobacteraceae bacterium]